MSKMFPKCTGEFLDCKMRHVGIELQIESFTTKEQRDEMYELIKKLLEKHLNGNIIEWVYLTKTEGHLQNSTKDSLVFGEDPRGNRSESRFCKKLEIKG